MLVEEQILLGYTFSYRCLTIYCISSFILIFVIILDKIK
jgi:hypothetical protein